MTNIDNNSDQNDGQEIEDLDNDDEFVILRSPWVRRSRILTVLGILAVIGLVLAVFVRSWLIDQIDPDGEPGAEIAVAIPQGSTPGDISAILASNEVVPNSTFFRLWSTYRSYDDQYQAGTYNFRVNMSADEALAVFREGPEAQDVVSFTIVEGLWLKEIVADLAEQLPNVSEQDLLDVLDSDEFSPDTYDGQVNWEGMLFPDTYEVSADATAEEVLKKMHKQFVDVAAENGYGSGRAERDFDLTPYEVMIIASLVELEAKTDADRPKISRVIHNRLKDNQWLDIDATLIYSAGERGARITASMLENGNDPYNTSVRGKSATINRLPPTPIGAPGRKSLNAAINPAEGDWYFYAKSSNAGDHYFSVTNDEHNRAVARAKAAGVEGYGG